MGVYELQRYLLMTVDPVHIGTGGYRLGRVDNAIVREPGTRLPKVPGTSLHGAARTYAARLEQNLKAAGKNRVEGPATDAVCYTFGYADERRPKEKASGTEIKAYSGVVNVCDAHIALFPVHSMLGPVWVSTAERLVEMGFTVKPPNGASSAMDQGLFSWMRDKPLNLGWLMMGAGGKVEIAPPQSSKWAEEPRWKAVMERIVLVHDQVFSHVVNSNLEVRTSVSIDPERGAAEEGALFTYEAIPRATFLAMDVIIDDYRDAFPHQCRLTEWLAKTLDEAERKRLEAQGWYPSEAETALQTFDKQKLTWKRPGDVVRAGLKMIEWLGVGGMGTRGFGRLAIVGEPFSVTGGEETRS
jgi:CRISPR-associated protein Cmr4